MTPKRNRSTVVRFPVFAAYEVRVIQSRNVLRTGQRLRADLSGAAGAFVHEAGSLRAWIVLPLTPDDGLIAHEASHAIRAMFAAVGARTDNETFAYHLGHLVGRIHKFLKGGH